jgi:hypothetical protein
VLFDAQALSEFEKALGEMVAGGELRDETQAEKK